MPLPTRDPQRFVVMGQSLLPGNEYIVTLRISYGDIEASAQIKVFVKSAPIEVRIKGGNRKIDHGERIVIDAQNSFDPDAPAVQESPVANLARLYFDWTCLMVRRDEKDKFRVCRDSSGEQLVLGQSEKLEFQPYQLMAETLYFFTPTVASDENFSRNSTGETAVIYIVAGQPPKVSIDPQGVIPTKINANERLALQAQVAQRDGSGQLKPAVGITCTWSEKTGGLNMTDASIIATSLVSRNLVIRPFAMTSGRTYSFWLSCTDQFGVEGLASKSITVNSPPSSGILEIEPGTGYPVITDFQFSSLYWTDDEEDLPLEYSFFYLTDIYHRSGVTVQSGETRANYGSENVTIDGVVTLLSSNLRESSCQGKFSSSNRLVTDLPYACSEGNDSSECKLIIIAKVRDQLGAESKVGKRVTLVVPPELDQLDRDLAANAIVLEDLNRTNILAMGAEAILRRVISYASLMNRFPCSTPTSTSERISIRSKLFILLDTVASNMDYNPESLKLLIEAIGANLRVPLEIPSGILVNLAEFLQDLVLSVTEFIDVTNRIPNGLVSAIIETVTSMSAFLRENQANYSDHDELLGSIRGLIRLVSESDVKGVLPGEVGSQVKCPLFSMKTHRRYADSFAKPGTSLAAYENDEDEHGLFVLPELSLDYGTVSDDEFAEKEYGVRILEWNENPYSQKPENSSGFATKVVEFTLTEENTGSKLELGEYLKLGKGYEEETANGLEMRLPISMEALENLKPNETIRCGYFDEEAQTWSERGCRLRADQNESAAALIAGEFGGVVWCTCNHTTDFAAWSQVDDVLLDSLKGDGFTWENFLKGWAIVLVLAIITVLTLGLYIYGRVRDARDLRNYQRAMYMYLVRQVIVEKQQARSVFKRLKGLASSGKRLCIGQQAPNLKQVSIDEDSPPSPSSNKAPGLDDIWYNVKMRTRLFSYFFQFDPVFNRTHRVLILECVLIGKLFTCALFFHFRESESYQISDQILIVLINCTLFGILVMVASTTMTRIPPLPGSRWRYVTDLQRLAKAIQYSKDVDRQRSLRCAGVDVHELDTEHEYRLNFVNLVISIRKAERKLERSRRYSRLRYTEAIQLAKQLSEKLVEIDPDLASQLRQHEEEFSQHYLQKKKANYKSRKLSCWKAKTHSQKANYNVQPRRSTMAWFLPRQKMSQVRSNSSTKSEDAWFSQAFYRSPFHVWQTTAPPFYSWWLVYIAYAILILWCLFCLYFLLSWGLEEGNKVIVDWIPSMLMSVLLSLVVIDPLLIITRYYAISTMERRRKFEETAQLRATTKNPRSNKGRQSYHFGPFQSEVVSKQAKSLIEFDEMELTIPDFPLPSDSNEAESNEDDEPTNKEPKTSKAA